MLKRVISIMLAAAMTVMLFSACTKEKKASISDKNGKYTPETELELTMWETQGTDYTEAKMPDENIPNDWLMEKSKVKFETIYGNDGGQWDTKLSRLVAGNNLPNLIHCGAGQGAAHFAKLKSIDKIWELTPELLEKYAPNVLERVPANFWERLKIDGKIYGIPFNFYASKETQPNMSEKELEFVEENYTFLKGKKGNGLVIRDDIAKIINPSAYSWDEIKKLVEEKQVPVGDYIYNDLNINSTEDYVKMMYAIKNLNLTENGKPVYSMGYTGGDNWVAFSYLGADMMGYLGHQYTSSWNDITQEMRLPLVEPVVKEAARIQNQMIRDKVIDPESLVHTITMFKEKALNGQYAIMPASYVNSLEEVNKQLKASGKNYQYRPFNTNIPSMESYEPYIEPSLWKSSIGILKTLSEEEMIQVLNWINIQFSDEFDEVIWWGPKEAGLYTQTDDGKRLYKDERFNKEYIELDDSALLEKDCKGLGYYWEYYVSANIDTKNNRWCPSVMHEAVKFSPYSSRSLALSSDSKYNVDLKVFPPCQAWSPEFANIPEVVKYWGNRELWEQPFKIAMAADSEEKFNIKWDEAVANLSSIVDIKEMCAKMTEVAREEKAKLNLE